MKKENTQSAEQLQQLLAENEELADRYRECNRAAYLANRDGGDKEGTQAALEEAAKALKEMEQEIQNKGVELTGALSEEIETLKGEQAKLSDAASRVRQQSAESETTSQEELNEAEAAYRSLLADVELAEGAEQTRLKKQLEQMKAKVEEIQARTEQEQAEATHKLQALNERLNNIEGKASELVQLRTKAALAILKPEEGASVQAILSEIEKRLLPALAKKEVITGEITKHGGPMNYGDTEATKLRGIFDLFNSDSQERGRIMDKYKSEVDKIRGETVSRLGC